MFDKLMSQMQEQAEEIKKKLDNTIVEAEVENGLIKVKATGNKKILSVEISDDIVNDKEALEDLLIVAINKTLEKAEEVSQKETGAMAKDMLPGGFGNMFG
ncbi:MAG: YbaB/EbfC family nucleoid-associated protein [Bacteroidetes bacterium]|nr:YbaB/EbfC family nucleoid-associated protein [Bacteroidales bacterium]RLD52415.1 MAG: YbaB/EbfC family nucleoid-associated protein [Bacteroidota bacterium]